MTNTGAGIPAEDVTRIFDRFSRIDKARTAGHGGLGLAISEAIVLAHGGTISCTAEPDGRVSKQVRLPLPSQHH